MNYIIDENGTYAHYFHHKTDGICRNYLRGGIKQERKIIFKDASDIFGLYSDGVSVHILTVSKSGELLYIKGSVNNWHRYILRKLHDDEKILKIALYSVKSRLHMLYTVISGDKIILASCVLGNNCMPYAIAELAGGDFNIINNRVYFKNNKCHSCFYDLSVPEKSVCIKIAENSDLAYTYNNHITFISDGKIFFDYKELCRDENASNIILTESKNNLYAVWRSSDGVKYMNTDMSESAPHTVLIPGGKSILYTIFTHGKRYLVYGNNSETEIKIYINTSVFSIKSFTPSDSLKEKLEEMKKEIELLRSQLVAFSDRLM